MRQEIYRSIRLGLVLILTLQVWQASASVSLNVVPGGQTVSVGENINFGVIVTASGGEVVTGYQWLMSTNNQNPFTSVGGSQALTLNNVQASNAGYYYVIVTYVAGGKQQTISSATVRLIVNLQPEIAAQPISLTNLAGSNAVFSVTVAGALPMRFQWRHNGVNLVNTGRIMGSTGTNLEIESLTAADSGNYDIVVTNFYGAATSQVATLQVLLILPTIISPTNAVGKQGYPFTYTAMATGPSPITFGATGLPAGVNVDTASGIISGVPLVSGSYTIMISATNLYGSDSATLTLDLASGVPIITGSPNVAGQQGQYLSYSIQSTNNAVSFTAVALPAGLSLDAVGGIISGVPLVSGSFAINIGAANAFGSGNQTLTMNLASGAPAITSPLNGNGAEEQTGFNYTITANNSPTTFWAANLPMGLTVDTNSGEITGTPLYAGSYAISLFAANAWGVGEATLQLSIANRLINNLFITDVMTNYLSPYLLEFKFSLRDGEDPTSRAVVASPALMSVTAFEDDAPVSPSETSVILKNLSTQSAKVLKGYLVLDFTESLAALGNGDTNANGISDAIAAEIASAQDFVNEQPADSQIGVYEFHRDDEAPQQVVPLTTDKNLLDNAIAGIWTNYVQNFPAGSRAWDALTAAITSLGAANSDESHYIVFMSDGQDDSSAATVDDVIAAATNASVQIYAAGFGDELDATTLQDITSSTLGRYYAPSSLSDLALDFAQIGKDLSSEYILRWATLKRSTNAFMPSFQINYQGLTAFSPSNPPPFISGTNFVTFTNSNGDLDTNIVFVYTTNYIISPYTPSDYASNVLAGSLRLVSDADVAPAGITLRATYAPRYIRQLNLHYRANWPVSLSLESTNPGEMLAGWTLMQTNDGAGGQWALLSSPDPTVLSSSIPYAGFGKLLTFSFHDPIVASNAFSEFEVDNSIYTNTSGTNFYGFTLANTNSFFTFYAPPPPHGTPLPWLMSYGFTTNLAAAELLDPNGNGLAVWQDYLAGLNPLDPNSRFSVQLASAQNSPQVVFDTVVGRTYRIEWATSLNGNWSVLRDGIAGTGGQASYTDERDLSSVGGMFYRVVVENP